MTSNLKIHLKPRDRIFVNGAVLRVDRKVTLEFLNDVSFLLESHVIQLEQATTPLRQLYYVVQSILMEPTTAQLAHSLFEHQHTTLVSTLRNQEILDGLVSVRESIDAGRIFEALRKLRSLFPVEDELLAANEATESEDRAVA
ncbi:MAG: flagellar biosynthesis repressor FlbT [Pseudomonadota bacterium]